MRLILIAAQSLDGYITRHDVPGSAFASPADRDFFHRALQGFDSCVMGAETYRTARDPIRKGLMPDRLRIVVTRDPKAFAADTIPGKLEFFSLAPAEIAAVLRQRGCATTALLGGAQIHSLFLEAKLVDELWLTIEPVLFGGGTPLVARQTDIPLELLSQTSLSPQTLLLKYRIKK